MLLFHCVTHREVRKHLRAVLAGKKLHLDDSATTRATLLTVGGAGDLSGPGLGAGGTVYGRAGSSEDQIMLHMGLVSWNCAHTSGQNGPGSISCPSVAPLARALERRGQGIYL